MKALHGPVLWLLVACLVAALRITAEAGQASAYFPQPESKGGWRKLEKFEDIRNLAGMDPAKLDELRQWLLRSDNREFAAVVIRNGYIVLEVERGSSAKTDSRRVASVSKAICATVLAIASEQSQRGLTPRKMTFDDRAFDFIPWAQPLSDPRKAKITVRQLLNHTSGICPEATGAPNDGTWDYILGHSGDPRTAKLAFDPGTACGYSTHALAHAALVCETVTGRPYDQFAIESLFKPLGIEHWWFQYYNGPGKDERHPSHGMGMPARDLARIAYCMLHEGRWNERQVIPKWFVEQTGKSSHDVKTPEMRWKLNAQTFSLGWERPALLTGEDGRSGKGIPADARSKPGSGGQFMAFVPSLDLVITRQTGSSGEWAFEEYLRLACAAVLEQQRWASTPTLQSRSTTIAIVDGKWRINGRITYPGTATEGLLMNVRMVNSTFEDRNKPEFDADANTAKFISQIPDYTAHGVRAFTLCLQGGMPGYEGALNSAFNPDGSLREAYLSRVKRVIDACDRNGAAVILGCYYQRQSKILSDEAAIKAGVINVVNWIKSSGFRNVVLEIANEYPHSGFAHRILKSPEGEAELIRLARQTWPELLVSASGYGDGRLHDPVAEASDFLLIHFNGTPVAQIPQRIAALRKFGKPIVCNEDDKIGEEAARAAEAAVSNGASWGFMHSRVNQYVPFEFKGAADDRVVYAKLQELTSSRRTDAVPDPGLKPPVQMTTEQDHRRMMDLLGIQSIRRGADGNNRQSPNYANYDESKANPFPDLPDPLTLKNGRKVTTAQMWWEKRRPEIVEDFDREIYGREPKQTPKVNWEILSTTREMNGRTPVVTKRLVGHVDNTSYPLISVDIQLTLSTPADANGPVPVMMEFGFGAFPFGMGGRGPATRPGLATTRPTTLPSTRPAFGGGFANFGPDWRQLVLAKGWGYAVIVPYSVQADNGAGLTRGIIGLCNKGQPRKLDDWGALRAWAWGASRALDYFETDPAVDAKRVGLEGHSRFGKATLVAMAYDPRFAIAFVSSSGEGGAKLHRRNWGEKVENVAGSGEYHWMAGNFIKYAGPLNWNDLPVDSHELVALCAPRPVFLSAGSLEKGDGWVDAKGTFLAGVGAGPVYRLLGKKDLGTGEFPPIETTLIDGDVAFRQHAGGHTPGPNWPVFIEFAERYFQPDRN